MPNETFESIEAAYREFMSKRTEAREYAKEEQERAYQARIRPALEDLSKRLQTAHAQGIPKGTLRRATKKYGDNEAFKEFFDAYKPAPGEFDKYNPEFVAAAQQVFHFVVGSEEFFDDGSGDVEWMTFANSAGETERVYVAVPTGLDQYNNATRGSSNPAAIEAARQHLAKNYAPPKARQGEAFESPETGQDDVEYYAGAFTLDDEQDEH